MIKRIVLLCSIVMTAVVLLLGMTTHLSVFAQSVPETADLQAIGDITYTRLTTTDDTARDNLNPVINDDGTKIVFHSDADFFGEGISDFENQIWLYDTSSMTITRVTPIVGDDRSSAEAAMNSDGTKIVFESDADFLGEGIASAQTNIWLYDANTMGVTRVTTATDSDRQSFAPAISGDGTKIAFESDSDFLGESLIDNQYEIWLYDTALMTFARLTVADALRDSGAVALNDDGTKIVFHSDADFLDEGISDNDVNIWLYDTGTMTVTRLTTATGASRDSFNPTISDDGTKIAFESDSDLLGEGIGDNQFNIWLYDTNTMMASRVTTSTDSSRSSNRPVISGDGTKIVFSGDSDLLGNGVSNDANEIWLYDSATLAFTRVTTASATNRDSLYPSIDEDGTSVVFYSDSDLLGEGIDNSQEEIWLYAIQTEVSLFLPFITR